MVGATLYQAKGDKAWRGALIGTLAAVAATYTFFYLRKDVGKRYKVKDAAVGGMEDAMAIGIAAGSVK
ncbi:hypothetical protein [Chitinophaga niastensis]|uniref:hypothetical protein n=1 Tax=Chitinophaga niastensis TaxID=536980 RepID=UPI000D0C9E84|nr:hypothetical protein [Chitinophaga niastensis]